jgi:hypothetical protein
MNETTDIAKYGQIPPAVIDTLMEDAKQQIIYVKPKAEGFFYKDNYFRTITGIITKIEPYWALWENKKIVKSFDKEPPNQDYERRCDIAVRTPDNFVINISLPRSSYNNLATYVKVLLGRKLQIHKTLTLLSCEEVDGNYGVFTVVNFMIAADDASPHQFEAATDDHDAAQITPDDDIPY